MGKVVICEEMIKFRELCDKRKIAWHDASEVINEDDYICRTHGEGFSCVNGYGTWGGYLPLVKENENQLEIMIEENEPIGNLDAYQAIEFLEYQKNKAYKNISDELKTLISLLIIMQDVEESNMKAVIVQTYIQKYGPIPNEYGDQVKRLICGEDN